MERRNYPKKTAGQKKPAARKRGNVVARMSKNPSYAVPQDRFRVSLMYSGTVNTNVTVFANDNFGVAGVGLRIPKYWNQYFAMYKYCYLEAVSFQFHITETNGRPLRIVVAESNTLDVTPTSYLELAQTPRSVQKLVISGGNQSVVSISKKVAASRIMGHKLEDDDTYWSTQGAGPSAPVQPLLVLGYEPVIPASVCNMSYQVSIQYHLKYFTLNHL